MNNRPTPQRPDVAVLGMGPGGEEVAARLAEAGMVVVGIEGKLVGGECPYWGCVPSKMMLRAAGSIAETRRVSSLAGRATASPDWSIVAKRVREEATDNWDDRVAVERFISKGGHFLRGWGRIVGPTAVEVEGMEIQPSRALVIATGTSPSIPPIPGLSEIPIWTNREAIEAEHVPASLLVLGGGAIGVELAEVFARFGSPVTIVEGAPRLLPMEEPEAGELLRRSLERDGIRVVTDAKVERASGSGGIKVLQLADGTSLSAEELLVATGRRSDLKALGASNLGLGTGCTPEAIPSHLRVDGRMRVGPGVWAVGDVTGQGAFTHIAMYQANIAVEDILGNDPRPADYKALPRVTFTDPEIASVGVTEAMARERGDSVRVGLVDLAGSARGWIHKEGNDGLVKLVENARAGVLVGATSAGPMGGEVLSMLTLAVHAGIPTDELSRMIFAYPTFHRAVSEALARLA